MVFHSSSHATVSGLRMTLSPLQLMVSSSFGFSLCCPHLLLSILQANRTPFSCSFSVFPLGSAFPCLSDVTNGRMCPSAVSDHLTVHGALPAAARPHAMRVTDCPQTPCAAPLSTWDCSPALTLDLLSRSNLQVGSYQHHCMAPAQAW